MAERLYNAAVDKEATIYYLYQNYKNYMNKKTMIGMARDSWVCVMKKENSIKISEGSHWMEGSGP